MSTTTVDGITFTAIKRDTNGNSRHVCHFTNFTKCGEDFEPYESGYALALARAHEIGGRKFSNKQFGGGIVFQAAAGELPELVKHIERVSVRWQVLTETICGGWVNCWSDYDDKGNTTPSTYPTEWAAKRALREYIAERRAEGMDDGGEYSVAACDKV